MQEISKMTEDLLIENNISSAAPLFLLEDHGFDLLHAVADSHIGCLVPIILPSFMEYEERPHYITRRLASAIIFGAVHARGSSNYLQNLINVWGSIVQFSESCKNSNLIRDVLVASDSNHKWRDYPVFLCRRALSIISDRGNEFDYIIKDIRLYVEAILATADRENYVTLRLHCRSLVHGDLHAGNILVSDQEITIIDLGNMSLGPFFSDAILFSLLVPSTDSRLSAALDQLEENHERKVCFRSDVAHSLSIAIIIMSLSALDRKIELAECILRVIKILMDKIQDDVLVFA